MQHYSNIDPSTGKAIPTWMPPKSQRPGLEVSPDGKSIVEGPNQYQGIRKIVARIRYWFSKL